MDKKKKIQMILGIAAFLLFGILYLGLNTGQRNPKVITEHFADEPDYRQKEKQTTTSGMQQEKTEKTKETSTVYVHICGAVKKPGVYTFTGEPHMIDVVKQAGGFTGKADQASVNLAEKVPDGTQLVIASKGKKKVADEEQCSHPKSSSSCISDKININQASAEELMTLSGIGESKAAQIVTYRESNGAFQKIEDIMNISGIKEGVFSKIKDYISV